MNVFSMKSPFPLRGRSRRVVRATLRNLSIKGRDCRLRDFAPSRQFIGRRPQLALDGPRALDRVP
jgi:hypothetical protein